MIERFRAARYKNRLRKTIQRISKKHGLEFNLVAAIVWKESRGNRFARRYEPAFFDRYIRNQTRGRLGGYWPREYSEDTERHERAVSWGLMQVLGQTARELGFRGDFAELLEIEKGIEFGCLKLRDCFERERTTRFRIARYNGSTKNPLALRYADDVLRVVSTRQFEEMFR